MALLLSTKNLEKIYFFFQKCVPNLKYQLKKIVVEAARLMFSISLVFCVVYEFINVP